MVEWIRLSPSSLAKGYDTLYSSSPLASLDRFSRSHGDGLYVMQLVVAATNQKVKKYEIEVLYLLILRFPPPIKLTATIERKYW
jgi:hypothetical protein